MGITSSSSSTTTGGYGGFSENEMNLLARIISAESRGEPYEGQVAVGAVILNRIAHPSFPNTLAGVIYQPGAFSCLDDGGVNAPVPIPPIAPLVTRSTVGILPAEHCIIIIPKKPQANGFFPVLSLLQSGNTVFVLKNKKNSRVAKSAAIFYSTSYSFVYFSYASRYTCTTSSSVSSDFSRTISRKSSRRI